MFSGLTACLTEYRAYAGVLNTHANSSIMILILAAMFEVNKLLARLQQVDGITYLFILFSDVGRYITYIGIPITCHFKGTYYEQTLHATHDRLQIVIEIKVINGRKNE